MTSFVITTNRSNLVKLSYYASRIQPEGLTIGHRYYKEVQSLSYKLRSIGSALTSSSDAYIKVMNELYSKACEDEFAQDIYEQNNVTAGNYIALKRSLNSIINDTAELYEALRFLLAFLSGGSAGSNLKSYLANNPQYEGKLRGSIITKQWNARKHGVIDLSVSMPQLDTVRMQFVEPYVLKTRYLPEVTINRFYNLIVDDVTTTLKEFIR